MHLQIKTMKVLNDKMIEIDFAGWKMVEKCVGGNIKFFI